MRTKELKKFILRSFGCREFYGYEVHKVLELQGKKTGASRLYRILDEMKKAGLLQDRWEKSVSGPKKRVYFLTTKGTAERKKLLLEAIDVVHDFYLEYLLSLPPEADVFKKIRKLISSELSKDGVMACIAPKPSVQLKQILSEIRTDIPNGHAYFINPFYSDKEFSIDDWQSLDGSQGSIPLKDNYLELLFVVGLPPKGAIDHCFSEWRRVIKPHGTLAVITPTILIEQYPDPLMIGMYMEKKEHEQRIDDEHINAESIRIKLGNYFGKVEEYNVVHMTLFIVTKPHTHK